MQFRFDVIAAACLASACNPISPAHPADEPARQAASEQGAVYTCPMHPAVQSDAPGQCPICNMDLVRKRAAPSTSARSGVEGRATAWIPPELQRRIGVRTSTVERRPFVRTIRAAGRVEPAERSLSSLTLRYGGWIEEVSVSAAGENVRRGDRLFTIRSPELYEAQRSYLLARASLPASDGVVRAARDRLLVFGLSEEQVKALEERGEPEIVTPVLAKSGGVVTKRDALPGMRVEPGAALFALADLSTVWVNADVYEDEIALVEVGAAASIEATVAGARAIAGQVAFVSPTISETTRTARVRVEAENQGGALRPGAFAAVSIAVDLGEQLVVETEAVLDSGVRQIAFVETEPEHFEPREVRLGARSSGLAVVLSGLAEGEKVVSRATFLVDSESRLEAALRDRTPVSGHAAHAEAPGSPPEPAAKPSEPSRTPR